MPVLAKKDYEGLSGNTFNQLQSFYYPLAHFRRLNKTPLSLCFLLFGNILADELVVVVLVSLVPLVVPIPIMFLGLFIYKWYSSSDFSNFSCGLYRRIHGGSSLISFRNSLLFLA